MGEDDEGKTGEEETGYVRNAETDRAVENGTFLEFLEF